LDAEAVSSSLREKATDNSSFESAAVKLSELGRVNH
jgi:hypothetical protein